MLKPRKSRKLRSDEAQVAALQIDLSLIRRDANQRIDEKKVEMLRQAIEMGRSIRPICVATLGDGTYRIVGDGRHRCEAHLRAGCKLIRATVVNRRDRR